MSADLFGQLYDTIAMDPPWAENGGGQCKRGADRHYPTVALKDMPALILNSGVWRPNPAACNVWCWTTANFLDGAVWLFGLLGVHYVSNIVWAKCCKGSKYTDRLERIEAAARYVLADTSEDDESFRARDLYAALDEPPDDPVDDDMVRIGLGQHFRLAHEHLLYACVRFHCGWELDVAHLCAACRYGFGE